MALLEAREKAVAAYRKQPGSWPDGIGAWYQPADWGPEKDGPAPLIAIGDARARALDPWANVRAKGGPCPPLPMSSERSLEDMSSEKLAKMEDSLPGPGKVVKNATYWREKKRLQRAQAKTSK